MMKAKKREVAKKTWVSSLIHGEFHKSEGWSPAYVIYDGLQYSRVSIVGTVVSKFVTEDGNYASITIDDGTETIRLKAFGPDVMKIRSASIGSVVRCIGKVRMYNEETYLAPEILRPLDDPNWILLHRLQVGRPSQETPAAKAKPQVPEQAAVEVIKEEGINVQRKMLQIIRALDTGLGADINEVIGKSDLDSEEAKNVLFALLKAGDVYEPRKGKLKVLD
jgi:RPA family protein